MYTLKNRYLHLQNLKGKHGRKKGKSYLFQSHYLKLVYLSLVINFVFLRLVWTFSILISMFFTAERKHQGQCSVSYRFAVPCCFMVETIFQIRKLSVTVRQKVFSFAVILILHSAGINSVIQIHWSWGHLLSCHQHKTIWKGLFYKLLKNTVTTFFFFFLSLFNIHLLTLALAWNSPRIASCSKE